MINNIETIIIPMPNEYANNDFFIIKTNTIIRNTVENNIAKYLNVFFSFIDNFLF